MPKYRITNTMSNNLKSTQFYIERKGIFTWKRIKIKENCDSRVLEFNSYNEAESYLINRYCRNQGEIYQPRPNEYHYIPYSNYF